MKQSTISIVIPLLNEAVSIIKLNHQVEEVFKKDPVNKLIEIIFINDGSTDDSLNILKNLNSKDSLVKIISFRKNLGKSTALDQGFKKAKGDIIVTIDADLQDDPKNIPILIETLNSGYDLVVGWKKERSDPLTKTIPSKVFNFLLRTISRIPLHDFNSGLKVMKKQTAKDLYLYGELHRFIPVLAFQRGYRISEIPVSHHPRQFGVSKYGWTRFFSGCFDFLTVEFLTKFGQRPFHLFGFFGSLSIFIGVSFGVYLSVLHFLGEKIGNRPLLILSVLLILVGLQFISIGFIAEMIIRKSAKIDDKLPIDYETD